MKNKLYLLIFVFLLAGLSACTDNDEINASDEEQNRLFMPMFRQLANTGLSDDPRASQVINVNDMYLSWYGIDGAIGYRIQMKLQSNTWDNLLLDTLVGPEVLHMVIEDLQYSTIHNFAIQALSPLGEEYHSRWYGYGDSGHNDDRAEWPMYDRYAVPDVLSVIDVTETSLRITFDLTYTGTPEQPYDEFEHDGNVFIMDEIVVQPSADNADLPTQRFKLTEEDLQRGYIDVNGLYTNAMYMVNGFNNHIVRYWDRLYNTVMVRMKGETGEPILIEHIVDPEIELAATHNASRLDTILNNYMRNNELAEGTTFLLEGGKTYFLNNRVDFSKGLTLKSNDPNKRAIVLMGLGYNETGGVNAFNFSFGRNPQSGEMGGINIQSIIIEDINFDAPYAQNYLAANASTGTGNYFINQQSAAMPFSCESFEIRNCDFRRMIRGWVRIQGPNRKIIRKFLIDNCIWHECGTYRSDGRGYAYFAGDGIVTSNIFNDLILRNSTIVDGTTDHFFNEGNNRVWPASTTWNITMENNTFINWGTMSAGRLLFNMRYNPANSRFTVKKNLFIVTKSEGDSRPLNLQGMNIRNFSGVVFDVADNYATRFTTGTTTYGGFTANGFNSASQGAGYRNGELNIGGMEQTALKFGATPIAPTVLMRNPNPIATTGGDMYTHDLDGLYYQNTPEVRNHEIYQLGIGDPRWRQNVTP